MINIMITIFTNSVCVQSGQRPACYAASVGSPPRGAIVSEDSHSTTVPTQITSYITNALRTTSAR